MATTTETITKPQPQSREEIITKSSKTPIQDAITFLGGIEFLLDSSDLELIIEKVSRRADRNPVTGEHWKAKKDNYVTGLCGRFTSSSTLHLPNGYTDTKTASDEKPTNFHLDEDTHWLIRWNFEPETHGPYVSVSFPDDLKSPTYCFLAKTPFIGKKSDPFFNGLKKLSQSADLPTPRGGGEEIDFAVVSFKGYDLEKAAETLVEVWEREYR